MTNLYLTKEASSAQGQRHPWVMAKDVLRIEGRAPSGATVTVCTHDGTPLAKASVSPESKIRARIWHWSPDKPLDHAWFKNAIAAAYARRDAMGLLADGGACRLVAAEGDGLPGVVIDRYASSLVVQLTTAGAERWRDAIVQAAVDISGASHVYERSDAAVRELEGLARKSGVLAGDPEIGSRDNPIQIQEGPARFLIDIQTGHKTGFYLDQAENRQLIAGLAVGKSVLNCFSYTGGFGIAAAASGAARVVNVDSSAPALALGERAMLDHPVEGAVTWMRSDVKKALAGFANDSETFDLVVLDPPKLAPTKASARKSLGVYGELNRRGFGLLPVGGMMATFSCSGAITMPMFKSMVTRAAAEAGVQVTVLRRLSAGVDHPVHPALDDAGYLKGLLLQRLA